jgi:hypothetical protein
VLLPHPDIVLRSALLQLQPLPTRALHAEWPAAALAELFPFERFNAVQSQLYHAAYHGDGSLLLACAAGNGAPHS